MDKKIKRVGRPTTGQFIWIGVGLVIGVVSFIFLTGFVSCWQMTALPGIPPAKCKGNIGTLATPGVTLVADATATATVGAPIVDLPAPWDGASRVSILVMGYDFGDWDSERSCPCRSDTMIVLTIDPASHTAGMISVPRDMWVNIPGFNTYNRINAALYLGELYKLPGGGPELAMKTVENFLGIPIQYFALVDFTAFERIIDTIGGVCINVPEKIDVGILYQNGVVTLEPGYQCLDGKTALGYARNRHTANGDVDRSGRQMQIILAARDKVIANFPSLIPKAGMLYQELSSSIQTNLSLEDILRLAVLAKDIPLESIQQGVIDYSMMQDGKVDLNGQVLDILRPFPDKVRELVDKVFGGGTMQPMASGTIQEKMQAEAARIVVVNGSGVEGLAAKTSDYLKTQGMNVINFGNTGDYPDKYYSPFPNRTIIVVHAGKPYAMQYLMSLMQFNTVSQIIIDFDPTAPEDVLVALGSDWAYNNPMP